VNQNVAAMNDVLKERKKVAYARERVAHQRRIVERLKRKKIDTSGAERTLARYQQSLANELKNLEKVVGLIGVSARRF